MYRYILILSILEFRLRGGVDISRFTPSFKLHCSFISNFTSQSKARTTGLCWMTGHLIMMMHACHTHFLASTL